MAKKLTTLERSQIADELRAGKSQGATARKFNRSPGTVHLIAQAEGIPSPFKDSTIKNLNDLRRAYSREGRLDLSDELLAKIRQMVAAVEKPRDLQSLAVAFGIAIEKRLLMEGAVTTRTQILGQEGNKAAIEKLKRFLDGGDLEVGLANGDGDADSD